MINIRNLIYAIASCFLLFSCKQTNVRPSPFIEAVLDYYITDSINTYLNENDYIIKVVTEIYSEKYVIDILGYEKKELSGNDSNFYGISYYKKYKILYYGDHIPQFTNILNKRRKNLILKDESYIEYDPIVFRIVLKRRNLEFINEDSYKINSLMDNHGLQEIVDKYLFL